MQDIEEKVEQNQQALPKTEIEALFEAGAHLGYSKVRRHPRMKKFIFGTRNNIEIFDLEQTVQALHEAEVFLHQLGKEGRAIMWVGTKPSARSHIEAVAARTHMPYVSRRWLGGTLTNFKIIHTRLAYWENLEKEIASGGIEKYVKKERLLKLVEARKLTQMFQGLRNLKAIPDALIIIDPREEHTAFSEAVKQKVSMAALLNNDCDPHGIKYPIPANDNAPAVISFVLNRLADAFLAGRREKDQEAVADVTATPPQA